MCIDGGTLQAYWDGELTEEKRLAIEEHLQGCPECSAALQELQEHNLFTGDLLSNYQTQIARIRFNQDMAWEKLVNGGRQQNKCWKGCMSMVTRYKKTVAVAAGVAVLYGSLSIASVRSFAADILHIFRVEKVQILSINAEDLNQLRRRLAGAEGSFKLDNFGEITVCAKNEDRSLSWDQARQEAGFGLKTVEGYDFDRENVLLSGGSTIGFKLHVEQVNSLIRTLGGTALLPEELENKEFSLIVHDSYVTSYYDADQALAFRHIQTTSPELVVPEGSDVWALRNALLELPILPENLRHQLAAVQDWQHTVPIPSMEGTAWEVAVNGVQGVYMSGAEGNNYGNLVWQKDGVLNIIQGAPDQTVALELAGRLK